MKKWSTPEAPDILRNTGTLPYDGQEQDNAYMSGSLFVPGESKYTSWRFCCNRGEGGPMHALSYACTPEAVAYRREFFDELMNDGNPKGRRLSKAFGAITRSIPYLVPQYVDGEKIKTYDATITGVKRLVRFPDALRRVESQSFAPRVWQELRDYSTEFLDANRDFIQIADEIASDDITEENVNDAVELLEPYSEEIILSVIGLRHQMRIYRAFEGMFYESIHPHPNYRDPRTVCKPDLVYSAKESFMEMTDMYHPELTYTMEMSREEAIADGWYPWALDEEDAETPTRRLSPVPNDFSIGGEHSMMLLTGPNTGGKSGFRMTAQMNTLLVSNGFWAFAKRARGTPFRRQWSLGELTAKIGKQGTFESVLDYGKTVMNNVTRNDIVFFDELDRGTTPADQQWFTRGVLEAFAKHRILTVGITHDLELAEGLRENPNVSFHRVADYEAGEERFKILPGIANSGYGRQKVCEKGMDPASVDETLTRRLGE